MNRKNLRIAIIGTHGTGKTTLVRKLGDILEIPVIEEMARALIMEGNKLPHDMDESERSIFQQRVFDCQISIEDRLVDFISDRSVLDSLIYTHGLPGIPTFEKMVSLRLKNIPYNYIFFVPREFPLEFDGVRKEDETYQGFIETEFLRYLKKFNLPHTAITGNVDERVHKVLRFLKNEI